MVNINDEKCIGCGLCTKDCFLNVIEVEGGKAKIKNDKCFKCGHCIAVCPKNAISIDDYNMSEVKEYVKEDFNIDPEVLLNFIKFRRTTRQFKNKEVDNDILEKVIEAGRFTQTGTNSQNVSYVVIKDKIDEVKKLVLNTLKTHGEMILANLNEGTMKYKTYAEMWINMCNEYEKNPKENDKLFFNAPSVILVLSDSSVNASLASSNMELMVNALGLGTFFSGFFALAAEKNPEIKRLLGIDDKQQIVTCMVIGYPNVKYQRTVPRNTPQISWT